MAIVAPTILATDPADFAARIDRVKPFAKRIHIDISDGEFSPIKTIGLAQAYGVPGAALDLHLMINHPEAQIDNALALKPDLIIVHFEAQGDVKSVLEKVRELDIKTGLAILPGTEVEAIRDLLPLVDHVLIFAGNLGYNGGVMDTECLDKISPLKQINPGLEIGIDGGVTADTGKLAVTAGASVLDSGSYIHDAPSPKQAYEELEAL